MGEKLDQDRYKVEDGNIIIEVAISNSRQLFNEQDPAPFRARDLDHQFVKYIVTAVEEFPLREKLKIRIMSSDRNDAQNEKIQEIREAIKSYFRYESKLAESKLKKSRRTSRLFFLIGTFTLIVCLVLSELISSLKLNDHVANIGSVGLVIIGWVAMWHPIETLLYGWLPVREQRRYFDKISSLDVDVIHVKDL